MEEATSWLGKSDRCLLHGIGWHKKTDDHLIIRKLS